jgi:chromosome segregation ATPase
VLQSFDQSFVVFFNNFWSSMLMVFFVKKIEQFTLHQLFGVFRGMAFTILSAFLLTFGNIAGAQAAPLTDVELTKISVQNARAAKASLAMEAKLQCFVTQDATFEERSRTLEKQTSNLHLKKDKLRKEKTEASEEEKGFGKQLAEIQHEVAIRQDQMIQLYSSLESNEAALRKCKKSWWKADFACDLVAEITGLKGDIRQLRTRQNNAKNRLNSIQKQSQTAYTRLTKADERHKAAKSALSQNKAAIGDNEAELAAIKSALSELRSIRQGYARTQSSFDAAYEDFNTLDPNSERRFVIRALRTASEDMAIELPIAEARISDGGLVLPSGTSICAE